MAPIQWTPKDPQGKKNGNGSNNGNGDGNGNGGRLGRKSRAARPGRWDGIERPYSIEDVERLRGSVRISHTLADRGAERLWELLHTQPYIAALGAMTGNQAVQQVRAGLPEEIDIIDGEVLRDDAAS